MFICICGICGLVQIHSLSCHPQLFEAESEIHYWSSPKNFWARIWKDLCFLFLFVPPNLTLSTYLEGTPT